MYKYLGGGFLPGVPARDLTDEEARQYGIKKISKSNLYKHVKDKIKKVSEQDTKDGETWLQE